MFDAELLLLLRRPQSAVRFPVSGTHVVKSSPSDQDQAQTPAAGWCLDHFKVIAPLEMSPEYLYCVVGTRSTKNLIFLLSSDAVGACNESTVTVYIDGQCTFSKI